jgi:ribosome-associated protein
LIYLVDELWIPEHEVSFTASRSGGPGGQNVNKVSSRVTLSFDLRHSRVFSEEQKKRIRAKLGTRINRQGVLRVVSQRTRSQEMNREDALRRFVELLRKALVMPKPRIQTRLPSVATENRLDQKRKHKEIKRERSRKEWD